MEKIDNNDIDSILDSMIEENSSVIDSDDFENSQLFDENKIPDSMLETDEVMPTDDPFILQRQELKVGLTPEDIKDLYNYMSGTGEKPLFIDKFTSDTDGRLKDMIFIMNLMQLSSLPTLMALQAQVRDRMFSRENLMSMDIKDLTAASGNLTKEVQGILSNAANAVQTFNQFGGINNEYRKLLDRLMLLPEDKFSQIRDIMNKED